MDFKEIKKIVELMGEFGLSQFTLEEGDTKLDLRKGGNIDIDAVQRILSSTSAVYASSPVQSAAIPQIATPVDSGQGDGGLPAGVVEIVSPMVGTFYSSPSPEADAFVKVGTKIQPDSIVCIVEAMKVMNQINADVAGEITEILVDNGTAVQYGEPLFRVKTA